LWFTSVIPVPERLRQEDYKFKPTQQEVDDEKCPLWPSGLPKEKTPQENGKWTNFQLSVSSPCCLSIFQLTVIVAFELCPQTALHAQCSQLPVWVRSHCCLSLLNILGPVRSSIVPLPSSNQTKSLSQIILFPT
jgi:hypothetical protein